MVLWWKIFNLSFWKVLQVTEHFILCDMRKYLKLRRIVIFVLNAELCHQGLTLSSVMLACLIFSVFSTEWSLLSVRPFWPVWQVLFVLNCWLEMCTEVRIKQFWRVHFCSPYCIFIFSSTFCVFYWHLMWKIPNLHYWDSLSLFTLSQCMLLPFLMLPVSSWLCSCILQHQYCFMYGPPL